MEATNQGATTDSHVEGNLVMEVGEEFTTCDNLLVELPPMTDNTFHFPMEGHVGSLNWVDHPSDDTKGTYYGPNAPFWRTSMGQALSYFWVIIPYFVNPPRDAPWKEEMYRMVQSTIDYLHDFQ